VSENRAINNLHLLVRCLLKIIALGLIIIFLNDTLNEWYEGFDKDILALLKPTPHFKQGNKFVADVSLGVMPIEQVKHFRSYFVRDFRN
jgi:hypothetical protein